MIYVNDLHKNFGDNEILKGVSIHIEKGECVVVIGPSGSGKSTFLRCLNKMEDSTSGEITIDGMDLNDKATNIDLMRRDVGMVFQHFNLFNHMTIMDNMTLAPVKHKIRPVSPRVPGGHRAGQRPLGGAGPDGGGGPGPGGAGVGQPPPYLPAHRGGGHRHFGRSPVPAGPPLSQRGRSHPGHGGGGRLYQPEGGAQHPGDPGFPVPPAGPGA